MTSKTGIVRGDIFLKHIPGNGCPDTPKRLESVYSMLDDPDMQNIFTDIPPKKAEQDAITLFHTLEYFEKIAETKEKELIAFTADTHACEDSFDAALYAAGSVCEAVSQVVANKIENAFALVRPPGHHAEKSRAMGYCLFNNVALGAMFAQKMLNLGKILIIDWDVHHGNGTQHAFENDPNVLFFSVHQSGLFPGTGFFIETGLGRGEGYTINLPIPKGYGNAEYAAIFQRLLVPVAEEFNPELILVSTGFDSHREDPMGGMKMNAAGFAAMTRTIKNIAEKVCGGKIVMSLEGGYNTDALARSVKAVLKEMADITRCDVDAMAESADLKKMGYAVRRCMEVHRHFWKYLNG